MSGAGGPPGGHGPVVWRRRAGAKQGLTEIADVATTDAGRGPDAPDNIATPRPIGRQSMSAERRSRTNAADRCGQFDHCANAKRGEPATRLPGDTSPHLPARSSVSGFARA